MLIKATTKKTDVFSKFLVISSLYHLPRWKSSIKRCKANLYHGYNVSNPEENGVSNVFQTCCDDMAYSTLRYQNLTNRLKFLYYISDLL